MLGLATLKNPSTPVSSNAAGEHPALLARRRITFKPSSEGKEFPDADARDPRLTTSYPKEKP